jgi:hypothetical protein
MQDNQPRCIGWQTGERIRIPPVRLPEGIQPNEVERTSRAVRPSVVGRRQRHGFVAQHLNADALQRALDTLAECLLPGGRRDRFLGIVVVS